MQLQKILSKNVIDAFDKLFNVVVENIEFQPTKKEFEGDITIVIFPFVKLLKQTPKDIAEKLGSSLEKQDCVVKYNVVSGFLNLVISDNYYLDFFDLTKKFYLRLKIENLYYHNKLIFLFLDPFYFQFF